MVEHEEQVNKEIGEKEGEQEGNEQTYEGSKKQWKPLKKTLTTKEIVAQSIVFLTAGYETTASTLSMVSYMLAKNPEIQKKLCAEIDEAYDKHVNITKINFKIQIKRKYKWVSGIFEF